MNFSRKRRKGARRRPFGLTAILAILVPTSIGYQDLASLMARQPEVSKRWREHLRTAPFGGIRVASFSFPRPVGTAIPETPTFVLASFDPRTLDVSGAQPSAGIVTPEALPPLEFPAVNRALKGNLLAPRPRPPEEPVPQDVERVPRKKKPEKLRDYSSAEFDTAPLDAPPQDDVAMSLELDPEIESRILAGLPAYETEIVVTDVEPEISVDVTDPATRTASLFFGSNSLGTSGRPLEPWADGAQPTLVPRRGDPDIKLSALAPEPPALPSNTKNLEGETIANKGEVTGEGRRPKTPAERLGISGPARAKAEKCLADAVYFESRGEPERGQIAVAQVVMNRVFSPFYPDTVCGVVYQNAHRHLACQFTFACEGKRLVVDEPDMWEQAKRIARDTLDGKIWLSEVGKSTHYHAHWVRPSWVREMKKIYRFGVHTFYRPLAWGNGADEPAWGSGATLSDADLVTGSVPKVAPMANAVAMPTDSIAAARM
jgi:spore germination cell wall hydrolase CwlJ-like protein